MALIQTNRVDTFTDYEAGVPNGSGVMTLVMEENTGSGLFTVLSVAIDNTKRKYRTQFRFSRPNGTVESLIAEPGQVIPTTTFNPVLRVDLPGWSYSQG